MRDAEQGADEGVTLGLRHDPLAYVDQDDREVRRGGARDHVARVLLVTGRVGDDEAPLGGGEVAVGDVDRDALLALGAQAVGQQRQVDEVLTLALAGLLDVRELVRQHLLAVVEQPPDQRALAVVDRARGGEPQQVGGPVGEAPEHLRGALRLDGRSRRTSCVAAVHPGHLRRPPRGTHQKYPCRFRSSIAASVTRSSALVWPRSVTSVAAISATTSASVAASDSTAPVQLMSPTVR